MKKRIFIIFKKIANLVKKFFIWIFNEKTLKKVLYISIIILLVSITLNGIKINSRVFLYNGSRRFNIDLNQSGYIDLDHSGYIR